MIDSVELEERKDLRKKWSRERKKDEGDRTERKQKETDRGYSVF